MSGIFSKRKLASCELAQLHLPPRLEGRVGKGLHTTATKATEYFLLFCQDKPIRHYVMTESEAGTLAGDDFADPYSTYQHPTMLKPPSAVPYDPDPLSEQKDWDLSVKYVSTILEELRFFEILLNFH